MSTWFSELQRNLAGFVTFGGWRWFDLLPAGQFVEVGLHTLDPAAERGHAPFRNLAVEGSVVGGELDGCATVRGQQAHGADGGLRGGVGQADGIGVQDRQPFQVAGGFRFADEEAGVVVAQGAQVAIDVLRLKRQGSGGLFQFGTGDLYHVRPSGACCSSCFGQVSKGAVGLVQQVVEIAHDRLVSALGSDVYVVGGERHDPEPDGPELGIFRGGRLTVERVGAAHIQGNLTPADGTSRQTDGPEEEVTPATCGRLEGKPAQVHELGEVVQRLSEGVGASAQAEEFFLHGGISLLWRAERLSW